jgi:hypothetical protein
MNTHTSVRGRAEAPAASVQPAVPVELSFDPDQVPETPVVTVQGAGFVAPVEPVVEPVVEQPELRYEYQPMDEHGRPLGGKQVIKYRTPDELASKLRDQNIELVRKLREVTRKQRLGIDDDTLPDDTEFYSNALELKEKPLTPEEVFDLSQDLNDPSKFLEAQNKLFESVNGCTPEEFRKKFNQQQQMTVQLLVKSSYDQFEKSSDFYPCPENKEILTDWMFKKGLAPTVKNFQLGHSKLKEAGLLLDAPIVREVTPVAAPVAAPVVTEPIAVPAAASVRIDTSAPTQQRQVVKVPSGLHGRESSGAAPSSEGISITLAEFDKLPADEMKKRLRDPAYAKKINDLLEAQTQRR